MGYRGMELTIAPTQTVCAHESTRSRGGRAPAIFSVLCQLHVDKCWMVADLGGAQEACALACEIEVEGVSTRYCKIWDGAGVLAAWILHTSKCTPPQHSTGRLRRRGGHLRGKLISTLQATRMVSQLSAIIRFRAFLST